MSTANGRGLTNPNHSDNVVRLDDRGLTVETREIVNVPKSKGAHKTREFSPLSVGDSHHEVSEL